jgi:hypothetical protein
MTLEQFFDFFTIFYYYSQNWKGDLEKENTKADGFAVGLGPQKKRIYQKRKCLKPTALPLGYVPRKNYADGIPKPTVGF